MIVYNKPSQRETNQTTVKSESLEFMHETIAESKMANENAE